jgi:hypothetical protein
MPPLTRVKSLLFSYVCSEFSEPSFEVVSLGRILKKITSLQDLIEGLFCLMPVWYQVLDENLPILPLNFIQL